VNQNGGVGQDAAGGGILASGSLTLENGILVQNNTVLGWSRGNAYDGNDPNSQARKGAAGPAGACMSLAEQRFAIVRFLSEAVPTGKVPSAASATDSSAS
jgi:hypothetical protein